MANDRLIDRAGVSHSFLTIGASSGMVLLGRVGVVLPAVEARSLSEALAAPRPRPLPPRALPAPRPRPLPRTAVPELHSAPPPAASATAAGFASSAAVGASSAVGRSWGSSWLAAAASTETVASLGGYGEAGTNEVGE